MRYLTLRWKQQWKLCDILRLTLLIKYFMRIFWSDILLPIRQYSGSVVPGSVLAQWCPDWYWHWDCPLLSSSVQYYPTSPPLHTTLHTPHQSHCYTADRNWLLQNTVQCRGPGSSLHCSVTLISCPSSSQQSHTFPQTGTLYRYSSPGDLKLSCSVKSEAWGWLSVPGVTEHKSPGGWQGNTNINIIEILETNKYQISLWAMAQSAASWPGRGKTICLLMFSCLQFSVGGVALWLDHTF